MTQTKDASNLAMVLLERKLIPIVNMLEKDEALSFLDGRENIRHAVTAAVTLGGQVLLFYVAPRSYDAVSENILYCESACDIEHHHVVHTAADEDIANMLKNAIRKMDELPVQTDIETMMAIIEAYNISIGINPYLLHHRIALFHQFPGTRALSGYSATKPKIEEEPEW